MLTGVSKFPPLLVEETPVVTGATDIMLPGELVIDCEAEAGMLWPAVAGGEVPKSWKLVSGELSPARLCLDVDMKVSVACTTETVETLLSGFCDVTAPAELTSLGKTVDCSDEMVLAIVFAVAIALLICVEIGCPGVCCVEDGDNVLAGVDTSDGSCDGCNWLSVEED
jgi:hypothetical protein